MKIIRILYYALVITFLFLVILVRYQNILNGYLVFVPLLLWSLLLITLTTLSVMKKHTKGLMVDWLTAVGTLFFVYVLIKFF